jgi:polar amino acid transport system permease protein
VAVVRVIPSPAMAPFKFIAAAYTDIFRGVPTILVVMLIGFGFPALGLGYGQTLMRVILPQAIRNVTPPLMNDFVSLQKDTALVSAVGVSEALLAAQDYGNFHFNYTPLLVTAAFFVALTIPLARFTDWLGRRAMRRERGR